MAGLIHALLYHGPLAGLVNDKRMQVELKSIGDGVVVYASGEAADAGEGVSVKTGNACEGAEFVGSALRMAAAASADGKAEVGETGIQSVFECSHDRRCYAGRMPVHAHHAAQRLKPKGIAEAGKEFRGAVSIEYVLGNGGAEQGHAFGEPGGHTPAVEGKIGRAGALHNSIFADGGVGNKTR